MLCEGTRLQPGRLDRSLRSSRKLICISPFCSVRKAAISSPITKAISPRYWKKYPFIILRSCAYIVRTGLPPVRLAAPAIVRRGCFSFRFFASMVRYHVSARGRAAALAPARETHWRGHLPRPPSARPTKIAPLSVVRSFGAEGRLV